MVKLVQFRSGAAAAAALLASRWGGSEAFTSPAASSGRPPSPTRLHLDLITYLRTEWISAALVTNQTPRSADVCLQLGTEDGRAVTFCPRTVRTLITSSAERDGKLTVSARRQLKQNEEARKAARVRLVDQRADDLTETEDGSVDVVISLQCAQRLAENGGDWKASVREAARVLKPGGRLLWVEQTQLEGGDYLSYLENLYTQSTGTPGAAGSGATAATRTVTEDDDDDYEKDDEGPPMYPVFEDIGWDDVNLVLVPHRAGVAIKAFDPALTATLEEQEERTRMADLSLATFERGIKKRKKKRKKKKGAAEE